MQNEPIHSEHARSIRQKGFTIIELLVVIAIVTTLAALLIPALNKANDRALSIGCLSNLRQLNFCWQNYKDDNDDLLVQDWVKTGIGLANPASNPQSVQSGALYSYNTSMRIYKCPGVQGGNARGEQNVRSYSISCQMNGKSQQSGYPVNRKFLDIYSPSPSEAFVFIEEHLMSIRDANFDLEFGVNRWGDFPAVHHRGGCNLSFADGHGEYWKWKEANTLSLHLNAPTPPAAGDQDRDLIRVRTAMVPRNPQLP